MPRRSANIPLALRDGPDPQIKLSIEEFRQLEIELKRSIPDASRSSLVEICDRFLYLRRGEISGEKLADAFALLRDVRKAVEAFQHYANGTLLGASMAGVTVDWRMQDGLARQSLMLDVQDLRELVEDEAGHASLEPPDEYDGQYRLHISNDFLMRLGISLATAANLAEKDLKSHEDAVRVDAFDNWLRETKLWASENSMPVSYNGPFADFLQKLNSMFPSLYREAVNSVPAMRMRLRRATEGNLRRS